MYKNDRGHQSVWSDSFPQLLRVDKTVFLNWQISYFKTIILQFSARVKYTFVVNLRRNYMPSFVAIKCCNSF